MGFVPHDAVNWRNAVARRNEDEAKGAFLCMWFGQSGGLHEPPHSVSGLREADSEYKVLGTSANGRVKEDVPHFPEWTPDIYGHGEIPTLSLRSPF